LALFETVDESTLLGYHHLPSHMKRDSTLEGYWAVSSQMEMDALPEITLNGEDEVVCPICLEGMLRTSVLSLGCGHYLHSRCGKEWLGRKSACPVCREGIKPVIAL
jgi:hypothetical protein